MVDNYIVIEDDDDMPDLIDIEIDEDDDGMPDLIDIDEDENYVPPFLAYLRSINLEQYYDILANEGFDDLTEYEPYAHWPGGHFGMINDATAMEVPYDHYNTIVTNAISFD